MRGRWMRLGPVVDQGVLVLFGDYGENTGPIDVLAVSPTGVVTTLLAGFDTEETDGATMLNGDVWIPSIDPRGANPASLATNHGGTWHTVPVTIPGRPVVVHLYGVDLDGTDLVVDGAYGPDNAFVWRSTDFGVTWTEDLAHVADGGGLNRFYGFRRSAGRLVVKTTHGTPAYYVRDGGAWVPTATVALDTMPREFDQNPFRSTTSTAPDGSVWSCNGSSIYLTPA